MSPFPPDGVAPGATNTPNPHRSAPEGSRAVSGDLRASSVYGWALDLAAQMEPEAFDYDQPADPGWREVTQNRAIGHAAKVWDLGLRLVSEDEDTVDRMARALCHVDGWLWPAEEADQVPGASTAWTVTPRPWLYRSQARAAIQALRGDE